MNRLGGFLAFLSILVLAQVMQTMVGILSAVAVAPGYFQYFGAHTTSALVLLEIATVAAPAFLLAFAWSYMTFRLARLRRWKALLPSLAAVVLTMLFWDVQAVMFFLDMPTPAGGSKLPLADFVMQVLLPWRQPWAIPNVLAMPLGVAAAAFAFRGPPVAPVRRGVAGTASPA